METAPSNRPRILILIIARNAEQTIGSWIGQIPAEAARRYSTEVVVIDDASTDGTSSKAQSCPCELPVRILRNPVEQGYAGSLKIGYYYAIVERFDVVVSMADDGISQSARIESLIQPIAQGRADAVLIAGTGGIRPAVCNSLLGARTPLLEGGSRAYSVAALAAVPFEKNSNGALFDPELLIQLRIGGWRIEESTRAPGSPVPSRAPFWSVLWLAARVRLQAMNLLLDPKFDCARETSDARHYQLKLDYASSHTYAFHAVRTGSRVLDVGCGAGYFGSLLREQKHCNVTGADSVSQRPGVLDGFIRHDLDDGPPPLPLEDFDTILLLDVIEHLRSPERFLEALRDRLANAPRTEIIATTGNVAFIAIRLFLLLGQFNYGKRGILDVTHTRLFTFSSFRRLFEQTGYRILEERGVPAPYPLALGDHGMSRLLVRLNSALIRLHRGLFSYQIFLRIEPIPLLSKLLADASGAQHRAPRTRDSRD